MSHCGWGRQGREIVDAGSGFCFSRAIRKSLWHRSSYRIGYQIPSSRAQVRLRQHAAELPRVLVRTDVDLPVSGCTSWQNGRWLIVLNGAEPLVRQRFSLAHEFKHAVDHRFRHELYFDRPGLSATTQAEYAADYFAACLLMPKRWLYRAWQQAANRSAISASCRIAVSATGP
jgi:Zn-dependent peptidase ImmA (M78 family)